jgi:hypothetical protein
MPTLSSILAYFGIEFPKVQSPEVQSLEVHSLEVQSLEVHSLEVESKSMKRVILKYNDANTETKYIDDKSPHYHRIQSSTNSQPEYQLDFRALGLDVREIHICDPLPEISILHLDYNYKWPATLDQSDQASFAL